MPRLRTPTSPGASRARATRPRRAALAASMTAAAGVLGLAAALLTGTTGAAATPHNTTGAPATSGGVKVAYFDQWSIYQNGYYPKNIDTSGAADKLDYLLYDFENISPTTLS